MRRLLYCLFFAALSLGSSTAKARVSFEDIYGYDAGGGGGVGPFSYISAVFICGLIIWGCVSNKIFRIGVIIYAGSTVCILMAFKIYGKEAGLAACAVLCFFAMVFDPAISNKFKSLSIGDSKYSLGFVAILGCLGLFFYLVVKPAVITSGISIPTTAPVFVLPAATEIIDSKNDEEPATQATNKVSDAKEQTSYDSGQQGGLGLTKGEVLVTGSSGGPKPFTPEQEAWLGNADRTDPAILARMRSAVPDR